MVNMEDNQKAARAAYQRQWRAANIEKVRASERKYREANRGRVVEIQQRSRRKLRDAALDAYGAACVCCGDKRRAFLQLDHIHDDGYLRRREGAWEAEYRELRDAGWPSDRLQVLCANCHYAKTLGLACPCSE